MAKKSLSMKVVVLLMAAVLLIGCSVGGTLAWLIANSETVTNTFVVGDINIELKEHELNAEGEVEKDAAGNITAAEIPSTTTTYKVLPGTSQVKDPFVRFTSDSEACWLFVQVQEVNNSTDNVAANGVATEYITYSVSGWTPLEEKDGIAVYYKKLENVTAKDTIYYVLEDNEVSYSADLTKADIDKLGDKQPQLIFKAFAVQLEAATTAEDAWDEVDTGAKLS